MLKYVYLYLTIFMSAYTVACQAKLSKNIAESYLLGKYTFWFALFIFLIYGNNSFVHFKKITWRRKEIELE